MSEFHDKVEAKGEEKAYVLIQYLIENNRQDDLKKAVTDKTYREILKKELSTLFD